MSSSSNEPVASQEIGLSEVDSLLSSFKQLNTESKVDLIAKLSQVIIHKFGEIVESRKESTEQKRVQYIRQLIATVISGLATIIVVVANAQSSER